MRPHTAILAVLGTLLVLSPAHAASDTPADLLDAVYITARDVDARMPYGDLEIKDAVIAIFPGLDRRLAGELIGDVVAHFNLPPEGLTGSPALPASGHADIKVQRAYLSASLQSDAGVLPGGRAVVLRRWEELSSSERGDFLEMYNAAAPDGWLADTGGAGVPAVTNPTAEAAVPPLPELRDPMQKEFFAAFWTRLPKPKDAPADAQASKGQGLARFDLKIQASGREALLQAHDSGAVLFQLPSSGAPEAQAAPAS